jgi:hypothetical protein
MGMFDYIHCEKKLPLTKEIKKAFPDTDWSKESFQTKSLDNSMATYNISKSGKLSVLKIEGEYVRTMTEDEEEKARKQKKFCWPYEFVESGRKNESVDYTGVVDFYYYSEDLKGNTWDLEFAATFVKGKLTKLVLTSGNIIRTAEENEADEKHWIDQHNAYINHPWTKTKKVLDKITFKYWSTFWKNVSIIIDKAVNSLSKLRLWIIRNMY